MTSDILSPEQIADIRRRSADAGIVQLVDLLERRERVAEWTEQDEEREMVAAARKRINEAGVDIATLIAHARALDAIIEGLKLIIEQRIVEEGRRAATTEMFQRYLDIIRRYLDDTTNDDGRLGWLCQTAIEQGPTMPLDKLSRWLGFVQGQLEALELITIDGERDYSRPLFHAAYKKDGIPPPETQEFPNPGSAPSKAARRCGRPVIQNSSTPTGYDHDD